MFIISSILILVGMSIALPVDPTKMDYNDTMLVARFFFGYTLFIVGALVAFYGSWTHKGRCE